MRRHHVLSLTVLVALGVSSLAHAAPDLIPRISIMQPPTWDAYIVARTAPGAAAGDNLVTAPVLSPTLPVWFDWAVSANAAIGGNWTDQMLIDGVGIQTLPRWNGTFTPKQWNALDAGPVFLQAGRHTVSVIADVANRFEGITDRYDNRRDRSLIWTPDPLGIAGTYVFGDGAPPPTPTDGAYPNNRAYAFAHGTRAWVLAMRPSVDYDLQLFDDFTNSTSGLNHLVAQSARTGDSLELIVGGESSLAATAYPAIVSKPGAGESGFILHWNDNAGHPPFNGDGYWDSESLHVQRLANLYEIDLMAGHLYPMSVWTREGTAHAHFAVFNGAPTAIANLGQALVRSQPVAGQDYEISTFTPATSGRYLIIAFRDVADYYTTRFQLAVGSQAVGVGATLPNTVWLSASPNPARSAPRLRFTLPVAAHARLEVLDVQGRHVRTVADGEQPAGTQDLRWDLKNDAGTLMSPGLYWARLDVAGQRRLARLSIIR